MFSRHHTQNPRKKKQECSRYQISSVCILNSYDESWTNGLLMIKLKKQRRLKNLNLFAEINENLNETIKNYQEQARR